MLIDGICQDMATREIFQPPFYIPRLIVQSPKLLVSTTFVIRSALFKNEEVSIMQL